MDCSSVKDIFVWWCFTAVLKQHVPHNYSDSLKPLPVPEVGYCLHASSTWVQGDKNMLNRPTAVRIWGKVRELCPRRAKSSQQSIYRALYSFLNKGQNKHLENTLLETK